ncbi:16163_t:CDS:2 [Funneliformis geosporum]|uniref:10551_t:CDS:1 n=1 Tax=Funneliformis geosporum TaxID=1117311 RepID=A0A9W4SR94_9GLOM|nr:16163_t:CDS:2 [Funneliformis geosporum]CAI2178697.1 10551_t:CDS:2 [Funneliformis geosporum]
MPKKRRELKYIIKTTLPTLLHINNHSKRKVGNIGENMLAIESGFPEGWFYIKSKTNDHVLEPHCLSVNAGARIVANKQRFGFDADSQLWNYDNGYIVNKASGKVLDIQGGYIRTFHRTYLCQWDRKPSTEASNQNWTFLPGGFISPAFHEGFVLHLRGHFGRSNIEGTQILIHQAKDDDHHKQTWYFEPEQNQPKILSPPIPKECPDYFF